MYRIRFHGRGGQGIKTASRILGNAFLLEGFEVQDAPRYGAERRGAPIFAYVRAARRPINERGIIRRADLIVVADDGLVAVPAAGVMEGIVAGTVLLIDSREPEAVWRERLSAPGPVLALPRPPMTDHADLPLLGAACAGAAARLVGCIERGTLAEAIREELAPFDEALIARNVETTLHAYDLMAPHAGIVHEGTTAAASQETAPAWIELPVDAVDQAGPAIYAGATSVEVRTGLWRILRPVIDYDRCNRCAWVCGSFCPDGAIAVGEGGYPEIDYEHCKGCMICVAQCPPHAIEAIPENEALDRERKEGTA